MGQQNKEKIARHVKQGRTVRGLTQRELSEIAGISLRSVQRIENAEVLPRMYTLKQLSRHLNFTSEIWQDDKPLSEGITIQKTGPLQSFIKVPGHLHLNKEQKIIMTVGLGTLLALLLVAFLAQSSGFPETDFELLLLTAGAICCYISMLLLIWR